MNYPDSLVVDGADRLFADLAQASDKASSHDGWSAQAWAPLAESGFSQVLCAEPGESGSAAWADAWSVFHAIGRHGVLAPLSESIIASALLHAAGMEVPAGPLTIVSAALSDISATRADGGLRLDGTASSVPWARNAVFIVVEVSLDGKRALALVPQHSQDMSITPSANLAGEPRDTLAFNACSAAQFADASMLPHNAALLFGATARSAMLAGAAQRALEQSVAFANDRKQFGRAIGKFQAIQQQLALAAGEVAAASTSSMTACFQAAATPEWFDIAVAKIRCGKAAGAVAQIAHQVHGAIGFTEEHPLHLATQRLWSWRAEFGSDGWWAQHLGRAAIGNGGNALWPGLTARCIQPEAAA